MSLPSSRFEPRIQRYVSALLLALVSCFWLQLTAAAEFIHGQVLDTDGKPIIHARVTFAPAAESPTAIATTVFSDSDGKYFLPGSVLGDATGGFSVEARALDYAQISLPNGKMPLAENATRSESGDYPFTIVMQYQDSQASTAPASAWPKDLPNTDAKAKLLVECVNCHQFPSPEALEFMRSVNGIQGVESERLREQLWHEKVNHMSAIFAAALARGRPDGGPREQRPASGGMEFFNPQDVVEIVELLVDPQYRGFSAPAGYDYGAPVAVNRKTVVREYRVPGLNAIREAISVGSPPRLWVADFYGDKVVRIDAATGVQKDFPVPFDRASGPHTLVRGKDDSLWLSGVFNAFVGQLDPKSEEWRVWSLKIQPPVSAHDLTYDLRNELATDTQGRFWYSDIANNAVGSFNPATGAESSFSAPLKGDRKAGDMSMYGIVMTSDRQHVCYTQLGGDFGCFNTETLEYETTLVFPIGAGPRRMAITGDDVIYIPLFGAGQLVAYDARSNTKTASYDLPDRASGPYAAIWDATRRVIWIATSNADVIYRFDPEEKHFSVIPLPRQKAYLRMLAVDPNSGHLVTSYGNLPETVNGPRMAAVIDPGD